MCAAYLRPAYSYSTEDGISVGKYSPLASHAAECAASMAAEEILCVDAPSPCIVRRLVVTLSPPSDEVSELAASLLAATPGIAEACRVYADGEAIGVVESAAIFSERLHQRLYSALPAGACGAHLDCRISFPRIFTRAENVRDYDSVIDALLIRSPAVYEAAW